MEEPKVMVRIQPNLLIDEDDLELMDTFIRKDKRRHGRRHASRISYIREAIRRENARRQAEQESEHAA